MAQTDNKTSLSSEEKRSLAESARLCEMIVEANPSDTGALETLKEIYTKLGDRENLARVVARLAGHGGGAAVRERGPGPGARARLARRRPRRWRRSPRPSRSRRPRRPASGAAPRRSSGARAACRASGTGWWPRSSSAPTSSSARSPSRRGAPTSSGRSWCGCNFITEDSLVSFLSKQYAMPAITVAQVDPDPDVLKLVPEQIAKKHSVLPIKRIGNVAHPRDGGSHQRLRARRRRVHDRPADPAGGRLRGGHPQGLRAPLRDRRQRQRHDERAGGGRHRRRGRRGRRGGLQPRPTSSTSRSRPTRLRWSGSST